MIDPQLLANGFEGNTKVIHTLTEDLTHEDSLLVPAFGENSLNWTLGHLVATRSQVLGFMGGEPILSEESVSLYQTGSSILDPEKAVSLPDLLLYLDQSTKQLSAILHARTSDDMAADLPPRKDRPPQTVGQRLMGIYWHEGYHIGQMELYRRLAGKTEKLFG